MRCVVTGAAGFIGSNLVDELLEAGHEVIGIDGFLDYYSKEIKLKNLSRALESGGFRLIEANLLELDLGKTLEGAEWIFHQAAQAGVRASWGEDFSIYTDNNVLATQRLLEAAKSAAVCQTLKKLVYASSSSIYGNAETLPTAETVLPIPLSPYGVSKLAAEHLMGLYSEAFGVPCVCLRYFTVYGPRQRPDMAFNRFVTAALKKQPISVYGDGEQTRDFTFISDIVESNLLAARSQTKSRVFNIGGGSRVSVNQVISQLEDIIGTKIEISHEKRQVGDARHTGADTALAKAELGFAPQTTLAEGLQAEVSWLSSL